MLEDCQITFSVNSEYWGINVENNKYQACIKIKHNNNEKKTENNKKKLKPYRRPRCKN